MADTKRGDFPEKICNDCGKKGCIFIHWGELVPEGKIGNFCWICWLVRNVDFEETKIAKPLGYNWKLVPEEFANKEITVKTESGSVYIIDKPRPSGWRKVSRKDNELPFTSVVIRLLRVGKNMCLDTLSSDQAERGWITSPVVSIQ